MGRGKTFFHEKKSFSPLPEPLSSFQKKRGILLGSICPDGKLGFLKKRGILLGSICPDGKLGFSRKAEYFVEGIAVKKATSL